MIDHELRRLAEGIAAHLDGFQVVVDDELGHAAWLDHPDGRRLFVRRLRSQLGRAEISGAFPKSDYYFQACERPRPITVAMGRSPAAVASEITRRLLPAYARVLGKVQAHIDRQAAEHTSRLRVAQRLAAIIPDASIRDDDRQVTTVRWSAPGAPIGSGDIELRRAGAHAALKADNLPLATVERLVAVLASLATTTPADEGWPARPGGAACEGR